MIDFGHSYVFILILNYNVVDLFVTLDHKTSHKGQFLFIHNLKAE